MSSSNDSKPDHYLVNSMICRLVERHPCMYDRSHPQYLKKDVVDKAWVKIAKEMDDSIPSCKERWRNIRTSFARSINVNKIPASANRTKPYYLHEELQFLARHITPGIPIVRRSNNNSYYSGGEESEVIEVSLGAESFDDFATMVQDDDSQGQQSSVDEGNEESKCEEQPPQQHSEEEEHEEESPPAITAPPKKRPRIPDISPALSSEQERGRDSKPADLGLESDFDAIFLQGLLPEMKAMDFRRKITFKRRIYEIIGEIFEDAPMGPSVYTSKSILTPSPNTFSQYATYTASAIPTPGTMAVVSASDLAAIRRLNNLLQCSNGATANGSLTAAPKNCASISSTVRSTTPVTATVAVQRGAVTRAGANLLRVTMVKPTPSSSPAALNVAAIQQQDVKEEPDANNE